MVTIIVYKGSQRGRTEGPTDRLPTPTNQFFRNKNILVFFHFFNFFPKVNSGNDFLDIFFSKKCPFLTNQKIVSTFLKKNMNNMIMV